MGSLIGGIVGGIGSIIGGNQAASAENEAAKTAMTGFNYLTNNKLNQATQANSQANIPGENAAAAAQAGTVGAESQLLTSNGVNSPAYQNYLNSTGYNFQLQQGSDAITGNAASKGLLNSGATAKALTSYGQNLGATTFNNYLGQMSGLASQQGASAATQAGLVNQGLSAMDTTGQAGTTGGISSGQQQAAQGQSIGTSTANAFNLVGGGLQSSINNNTMPNFFAQPTTPSDLQGLV